MYILFHISEQPKSVLYGYGRSNKHDHVRYLHVNLRVRRRVRRMLLNVPLSRHSGRRYCTHTSSGLFFRLIPETDAVADSLVAGRKFGKNPNRLTRSRERDDEKSDFRAEETITSKEQADGVKIRLQLTAETRSAHGNSFVVDRIILYADL